MTGEKKEEEFEKILSIKEVLRERDDTILYIINTLRNHKLITHKGFNKHSTKILERLGGKTEKKECEHEFLLEVHAIGIHRLRCVNCGMEGQLHNKTLKLFNVFIKELT